MNQPRLTPKQERFAALYWELGNASEAYRQAYDAKTMKEATINRSAFELLQNPKIAARVEILRQGHIIVITAEGQQAKLERVISAAMAKDQHGAVVAAIVAQSKLAGLVTEKIDQTVTDKRPSSAPEKVEALRARARNAARAEQPAPVPPAMQVDGDALH